MNDLMLDLETLGTKPGSVILSIGAVFFDVKARALGPEFYRIIDLQDSMIMGLAVEASTIKWWMLQSDAARVIFNQPGESLAHTLSYFSQWALGQARKSEIKLWGCGSDFDNVLLDVAYEKCGLSQIRPWEFYNNRDYRTIKSQKPEIKIDRSGGVHHNALDDAKSQALHMIRILNPLPPVTTTTGSASMIGSYDTVLPLQNATPDPAARVSNYFDTTVKGAAQQEDPVVVSGATTSGSPAQA